MKNIQSYLDQIEDMKKKERIQNILEWIQDQYPSLETRIAWNQPHFVHEGTFILGLSYAKMHVAIAPERVTVEIFEEEAHQRGYDTTQQLIKIKWDQDVDYDFIRKIIDFNISEKKGYKSYWR